MNPSDKQTESDIYFTGQSSSYDRDSESGLWRYVKEKECKVVQQNLGNIEGASVLEVGCGKGWYTKRLMSHNPAKYVSMDRLIAMVRSQNNYGVLSFAADINAIPLKLKFDRILCAGVLEFVPRPEEFFREAAQLLSPGGRIVVLAPLKTIGGRIYRWWHRRHNIDINLFDEDDFSLMVSKYSLAVINATRILPFTLVIGLEKK